MKCLLKPGLIVQQSHLLWHARGQQANIFYLKRKWGRFLITMKSRIGKITFDSFSLRQQTIYPGGVPGYFSERYSFATVLARNRQVKQKGDSDQ